MNYRLETCKKLEILLDKEFIIDELIEIIEEIVDLKGIVEQYKTEFANTFIPLYIPSVFFKEIEYNEDFDKNVATIEYYFGEDDNQVFIECEVIEDNPNDDLACKVKVIDIWT